MEEMASMTRKNAENAVQAAQLATDVALQVRNANNALSHMVASMTAVRDSSNKVAKIIKVIDEIAFQTNILALNAAVEAARAGEEGRGFAVVAAEVRSLAHRSAEAARQIKQLTQDSAAKVRAGSELVGRSGATLGEIIESAQHLTEQIADIASASRQQSAGVDEINGAIAQMESLTQSNAAQTEEITATSDALAAQAEHLRDLVSHFRLTQVIRPDDQTSSPMYRVPAIGLKV